jgi:hypothetical protein
VCTAQPGRLLCRGKPNEKAGIKPAFPVLLVETALGILHQPTTVAAEMSCAPDGFATLGLIEVAPRVTKQKAGARPAFRIPFAAISTSR